MGLSCVEASRLVVGLYQYLAYSRLRLSCRLWWGGNLLHIRVLRNISRVHRLSTVWKPNAGVITGLENLVFSMPQQKFVGNPEKWRQAPSRCEVPSTSVQIRRGFFRIPYHFNEEILQRLSQF